MLTFCKSISRCHEQRGTLHICFTYSSSAPSRHMMGAQCYIAGSWKESQKGKATEDLYQRSGRRPVSSMLTP